MIKVENLINQISKVIDDFDNEIRALKLEGKSTASKQCMKTYAVFDRLCLQALSDQEATKELISRLDKKYNKVSWVEITKQEYIKLLSDGETQEENLKAANGKYYSKR